MPLTWWQQDLRNMSRAIAEKVDRQIMEVPMRKLKVHLALRSSSVTACGRTEETVQDTRDPDATTCRNCHRTHLFKRVASKQSARRSK